MGTIFPGKSVEDVSRSLVVSMDGIYLHNAFYSLLSKILKRLL